MCRLKPEYFPLIFHHLATLRQAQIVRKAVLFHTNSATRTKSAMAMNTACDVGESFKSDVLCLMQDTSKSQILIIKTTLLKVFNEIKELLKIEIKSKT